MPKFSATKDELILIFAIATSPHCKILLHEMDYSHSDFVMDLDAVHSNGCPLDLNALLFFSDEERRHDIHGIRRNINRKTGQLENCFLPRCAKKEATS